MISILIPAYNRQAYIEQCVQSALNQSLTNIEVIIIDDGSTDGTSVACDSMAEKDSRIRVIHQPNGGVSSARQTGIDVAKGEWICFLDSDDTLPARALENYSKVLDSEPDIVVSGHTGQLDAERFLIGISDYSIFPGLCGKMFKASFLKANMPTLPRELVVGEDMIANLVLGLSAGIIATVPELQYQINLNNSSSVTKRFKKSFTYETYFFGKLEELFLSKCSSLPIYDNLVRNSVLLKLNGYKTVVLDGNHIDTNSLEWREFVSQVKKYDIRLGPSDKLFFLFQNNQKIYCKLMNLYLKCRQ